MLPLALLLPLASATLLAQAVDANGRVIDFISRFTAHGEVVIEGYGPAPAALVTSTCGGRGQTDSAGKFVLSGSAGAGGRQSCEVTVQAPGCDARSIPLMGPAGSVALGTIVLQPLFGRSGGGTVSFLSMAAPEPAKKLREQARKSLGRNKPADARRDFEKALAIYEQDPEGWHELGLAHKASGDSAAARGAFEKARSIDKRFVPPSAQLSLMAMLNQDWALCIELGEQVVAANPVDFPDQWLYLATARLKLGDSPASERDARQAIEASRGKLVKARHILGIALAQQGRTADAVAELREFLREAPKSPDAPTVEQQIKIIEARSK